MATIHGASHVLNAERVGVSVVRSIVPILRITSATEVSIGAWVALTIVHTGARIATSTMQTDAIDVQTT